jgi:hypothetical protein
MYYNITRNGKCDSMKNMKIRQSAAKLLGRNTGEGSTTTVNLKALKSSW